MVRTLLTISLAIGLFGATGGSFERAPLQPPPPPQAATGTGTIAGQVVDGRSGSAVADAVVALGGRGLPLQRVLADPTGRFTFPNLPAGVFILTASKPGFATGTAGSVRAQQALRQMTLTEGRHVGDVMLRLWQLGVITGTATGDGGEPLVGLEVHAWRRSLLGGRWIWTLAASAHTDDRGVYRISGLPPGDYVVFARPAVDPETPLLLSLLAASPEAGLDILAGAMTTTRKGPATDATVRIYATTFFPGAPVVSRATVITIDAGDERANVNMRLTLQAPVHVSGTVTGAASPLEGLTVRLVPADVDGTSAPVEAASTACESDGRFEFPSVAPGRYVVSVLDVPFSVQPGGPGQPPPPPPPAQQPPQRTTGPTWWARVPVTVAAAEVANLAVALHQGATIGGTIAGASDDAPWPREQAGPMTLRLDRVDAPLVGGPASWPVSIEAGKTFRSIGVPPGRYLLRVGNPPRGWTPASALVAGRDVLDEPLPVASADVTVALMFTDRPLATLRGSVRDENGATTSDAAVAIFPTNQEWWSDAGLAARRLKLSRPDPAGVYSFGDLLAGDYFVVAVRDDLPGDWPDPRRLAQMSVRASRLSITSPSQTLDLKVLR